MNNNNKQHEYKIIKKLMHEIKLVHGQNWHGRTFLEIISQYI